MAGKLKRPLAKNGRYRQAECPDRGEQGLVLQLPARSMPGHLTALPRFSRSFIWWAEGGGGRINWLLA